jgi:hypothetical protein
VPVDDGEQPAQDGMRHRLSPARTAPAGPRCARAGRRSGTPASP